MKAIVIEIQIGGLDIYHSLWNACREYANGVAHNTILRSKINFAIKLPDGKVKYITIRDEDEETVAYGDFEGLPSALDYAKEVING